MTNRERREEKRREEKISFVTVRKDEGRCRINKRKERKD